MKPLQPFTGRMAVGTVRVTTVGLRYDDLVELVCAARPATTESRRPWWYPPSWVEDVGEWLRACREVGAVAGLDVPDTFVPKPDPPPCIGFHR